MSQKILKHLKSVLKNIERVNKKNFVSFFFFEKKNLTHRNVNRKINQFCKKSKYDQMKKN